MPRARTDRRCLAQREHLLSHLVLEFTASCFDSRTRTLGGGDTMGDRTTNFAGQHDFDALYVLVDQVGILQGLQG